MSEITIRDASDGDAAALAVFARRVFEEVFGPDNDPQDMKAYLDEAFGTGVQRSEIADSGNIVLIAETPDGELAGYLLITRSAVPECVADPKAFELQRLYVDPNRHGGGLGKRLMDDGVARAKAAGATSIWLGVWEHNVRAQRFYVREGFARVGEHAFVLGTDLQTDWIMQRRLA